VAGQQETIWRARVLGLGVFLTSVVAGVMTLAAGGSAPAQTARGGGEPNIVVVITDDQTKAAFNGLTMPYTRRVVAKQGTVLADAVVTSPLCCPSRASFMTGQYTHNHGAWNSYATLTDPASHLGSWLRSDGYRTAMVGKYFNHYHKAVANPTKPAPGWDQWRMLLEPMSYFNYDVSVNGDRVHRGGGDGDYSTTYLNREAVGLVRRWAPSDRPFFLWLSPHAPHDEKVRSGNSSCAGRAVPAPGDESLFANAKLPRTPAFNERKMADKPRFMRQLKRLTRPDVRELERVYRCRLASLREVDRGVKAIVEALRAKHDLNDTVIVFTSDNGLFYGEHRLRDGKRLAYEEAIDVPLAMRVPANVLGGGAAGRVSQPVANIDLAPTVLELAGSNACGGGSCRVMDGRSMVPLLRGDAGAWPADRGRLVEMRNCRYSGMLAEDELVVHHISVPKPPGKRGCKRTEAYERYDLAADPFQLRSRAKRLDDIPDPSRKRLNRLKDCQGIDGRDPAPPPGSVYCE
jgi:N-acetylglucosamine-6-sulfatase